MRDLDPMDPVQAYLFRKRMVCWAICAAVLLLILLGIYLACYGY